MIFCFKTQIFMVCVVCWATYLSNRSQNLQLLRTSSTQNYIKFTLGYAQISFYKLNQNQLYVFSKRSSIPRIHINDYQSELKGYLRFLGVLIDSCNLEETYK